MGEDETMRKAIAFLFGRIFIYFFNLCGIMDRDMAFAVLADMFYALIENDPEARKQMLLKLAPYFRR